MWFIHYWMIIVGYWLIVTIVLYYWLGLVIIQFILTGPYIVIRVCVYCWLLLALPIDPSWLTPGPVVLCVGIDINCACVIVLGGIMTCVSDPHTQPYSHLFIPCSSTLFHVDGGELLNQYCVRPLNDPVDNCVLIIVWRWPVLRKLQLFPECGIMMTHYCVCEDDLLCGD